MTAVNGRDENHPDQINEVPLCPKKNTQKHIGVPAAVVSLKMACKTGEPNKEMRRPNRINEK